MQEVHTAYTNQFTKDGRLLAHFTALGDLGHKLANLLEHLGDAVSAAGVVQVHGQDQTLGLGSRLSGMGHRWGPAHGTLHTAHGTLHTTHWTLHTAH